MTKEA